MSDFWKILLFYLCLGTATSIAIPVWIWFHTRFSSTNDDNTPKPPPP